MSRFIDKWKNEVWSQMVYDNIPDSLIKVVPADIGKYCKNFAELNPDQRKRFYVMLFSCLAKFESNFNPKATYVENFKDVKGKSVVSAGLFQVSIESANSSRYGNKIKTTEELFNPETNIKVMLSIMSYWIKKSGRIATDSAPWGGASAYWSPFRKADRKASIAKDTLAIDFKGGVMEESIYDKFYAAAKSQMGIAEEPGKAHAKAILAYHDETTLDAPDDETPWCSSFANWVTVNCGVKGTRSAAAKSWMKWGKELITPVKGCIVVFTRTGGGHVAFYDSEDKNYVYTLGGNQGDRVCIAAYPKSRLLGYRGV